MELFILSHDKIIFILHEEKFNDKVERGGIKIDSLGRKNKM